MAGIGFALRDLMRRDSLWSVLESQIHGTIAVAGPWFFTIASMSLPSLLFGARDTASASGEFVTLLLYVFSVSLTVTSPIVIVATRHVSDQLYAGDTDDVAADFVGALLLALLVSAPLVAFGALSFNVPPAALSQCLCAYTLVTMNWIAAPMLSTFRQFRLLTGSYGIGTLVFAVHLRMGPAAPAVDSLLLGFNLGLAVTNGLICGLLLHNFPGRSGSLNTIMAPLRKYRILALSGLLYGLGLWVDKWLMWGAPERVTTASGLVTYPMYDTVMFIAYITTVPALALFVIRSETAFQERCDAFYQAIGGHADVELLKKARADLQRTLLGASRDVVALQGSITALLLLLPTAALDAAHMPTSAVFMLRFCAIGAAFQTGAMLLCIVLLYFDSRRDVLAVNAVFLAMNGGLTWMARQAGLRWYGAGYFVAGIVAFALAYALLARALDRLLYLAFVQQNPAVSEAPAPRLVPPVFFAAQTGPGPLGPSLPSEAPAQQT